MDYIALKTELSASPLAREVPRRRWFAARVAIHTNPTRERGIPSLTLRASVRGIWKTALIPLLICISLAMTSCTPSPSSNVSPSTPASNHVPPILLFRGTGTSANDVAAIETILKKRQLEYSTVDSQQLDGMSQSQLLAHRLLIVPGGDFIEIGSGLTPGTTANVRQAVEAGLNYLGICAGGLLAGAGPHNNLNLTAGVKFDFYSDVNQGIHKNAVAISYVDTPPLEHYWEDGPQFTGWGDVVGKYPDGTPAIAQGTSGKGWVILCGVHPEAPENWRTGMNFTTPASVNHAYADTLIDAALHRKSLPHY